MLMYFAGADANPKYNALLHSAGVTNKLESYYSLKGKPPSEGFGNVLLDSGGFAARTRNITISVKEYADFINRNNIKLAFNLDTNDKQETNDNQAYLEKTCPSCYIIPIYHMSDWLEKDYFIKELIKKYPYIGLGGTAGVGAARDAHEKFLSHCFAHTQNKVRVHGLGMTSQRLISTYPFYSVDSTSWLSAARYGNSIDKSDARVTKMRARTRHYLHNTLDEIKLWKQIEDETSRAWELKGVKWEFFR